LHGHRYTVTAFLDSLAVSESEQLVDGMVLDFGFLKRAMMKVIHDPYDHKMILYGQDPFLRFKLGDVPKPMWNLLRESCVLISLIPTAENLAKHWFDALRDELLLMSGVPVDVRLTKMEVQETPTSIATYAP